MLISGLTSYQSFAFGHLNNSDIVRYLRDLFAFCYEPEIQISLSSRPAVGFLDTPLEIRQQTYQYNLASKIPLTIYHMYIDPYGFEGLDFCDNQKSLLLVSKKVGSEAL